MHFINALSPRRGSFWVPFNIAVPREGSASQKLLDAGRLLSQRSLVFGGWATTAAYQQATGPVPHRYQGPGLKADDMLIAPPHEGSLDILHKNYLPHVPDRD